MPLIIAPRGRDLRVTKILTDEKVKKHLESLGITIGSIVNLLSQSGGSAIVIIKQTRLALDENLASKIFVA